METQQLFFTLSNFSRDEINIILNSLGARPFVEIAPLINKISEQCNAQIAQSQMPVNQDDESEIGIDTGAEPE